MNFISVEEQGSPDRFGSAGCFFFINKVYVEMWRVLKQWY